MKKYLRSICAGIAIILLCGCSSETSGPAAKKNGEFSGFEALASGNWDEAISFFQEKTKGEEAESIDYLGLARAEIGAGRLEEAKAVLEEAYMKFPDNTSILYYLGEVSNRLEDYEQAADSYYSLFHLMPEDKTARERLNENLWEITDYEKIFSITKELYEKAPDSQNALKDLLWACSRAGVKTHMEEVLNLVKGSENEYPAKTAYEAYQAEKAGDREQAMKILFQSKRLEELCWGGKFYLGDCDSEGNGTGTGIGIQSVFDGKGAMIGTWENGRWNGECAAWSGSFGISTTRRDGVEYSGNYYYDTIYTGQWANGAPEGAVEIKKTRRSFYEGHEEYNSENRTEGTINFVAGKAEGRTVQSYSYYSNHSQEWRESEQIIHEFKEGEPQPFTIETEEGEKTVYEARIKPGSNGKVLDYMETPCDCRYVWE